MHNDLVPIIDASLSKRRIKRPDPGRPTDTHLA
jgi:hypothetical protein